MYLVLATLFIGLSISGGAFAQQALENAGSVSAQLGAGDADTYEFHAEAGDTVSLTMADVAVLGGNGNLAPQLSIFLPDDSLWDSATDGVTAQLVDRTVPETGTYTVRAEDFYGTYAEPYDLYFNRVPGANEGGTLPNGGSVSDGLSVGDLDSYTFFAKAGETITLTMADVAALGGNGNLAPQMSVYLPDGSLWESVSDGVTAQVLDRAVPVTGTYTVQAKDLYGTYAEPYDVYFNRVPGANEGGRLVSGATVSGELAVGDLDSYIFYADAGDTVGVTMVDVAGFGGNGNLAPELSVYLPDGALWRNVSAGVTARIADAVPASGIYTVQAKDLYRVFAEAYELSFERSCAGVCVDRPDDCAVAAGTHEVANGEWHMLGLPCTPPRGEATVEALFGDDVGGVYGVDWVVFAYDPAMEPAASAYVNPGASGVIEQGTGFWFIHRTGTTVALDVPDGSTYIDPTVASDDPACVGPEPCVATPLADPAASGLSWNMIGHPFTSRRRVAFDDLRLTLSSGACADGCSVPRARAENLMREGLFHFDGSAYGPPIADGSVLDAWKGYWAATAPGSRGRQPSLVWSGR